MFFCVYSSYASYFYVPQSTSIITSRSHHFLLLLNQINYDFSCTKRLIFSTDARKTTISFMLFFRSISQRNTYTLFYCLIIIMMMMMILTIGTYTHTHTIITPNNHNTSNFNVAAVVHIYA